MKLHKCLFCLLCNKNITPIRLFIFTLWCRFLSSLCLTFSSMILFKYKNSHWFHFQYWPNSTFTDLLKYLWCLVDKTMRLFRGNLFINFYGTLKQLYWKETLALRKFFNSTNFVKPLLYETPSIYYLAHITLKNSLLI